MEGQRRQKPLPESPVYSSLALQLKVGARGAGGGTPGLLLFSCPSSVKTRAEADALRAKSCRLCCFGP